MTEWDGPRVHVLGNSSFPLVLNVYEIMPHEILKLCEISIGYLISLVMWNIYGVEIFNKFAVSYTIIAE